MNPSSELELKKILNLLYARKRLILAVAFIVAILTAYVAMTLPDIYRSSILILISPQRLPPSYVAPTVTTTVEQRIRIVSEEILSRTSLEKVVREFNLYAARTESADNEARVEKLRKHIQIEVRNNDSFRLSFEHENPDTTMQVTSRLGSIFIEENLQAREQQAIGTSNFMSTEADRLRKELEINEIEVNNFKSRFRNELPDQLDANLRTLEQLRNEQQGNMVRLTSLQERKANLEKQLIESEFVLPESRPSREPDAQKSLPLLQQLELRKQELQDMLSRYSAKHPDTIRLKKEVQALEAEAELRKSEPKQTSSPGAVASGNPLQQAISKQIADVSVEIVAAQATNANLRSQISAYQARVDNTSVRAIELAKVSRTYEITLKKYQDLLAKSFDSQLSQNMEKQQKGERFRLVDPAQRPEKPVRPNRLLIALLGVLAGIGAGVGLALLQENMDTSFKRGEDLEGYLKVPLLAAIPAFKTRGIVLEQRRMQQLAALALVTVLAVGFVLLRFVGSFLPGF